MDHPLITNDNKIVRKRVILFIRKAYLINRQSNIVFVCGGSKPADMRKLFQKYFFEKLLEFEFFEPEFAMKNYFSAATAEQFDIAAFEELVGELSHAIVLFPEGPGSFAETGYFSATPQLSKKIILAVDSSRQKGDSFISMGPAKRIQESSIFSPNIQIDYENPDFDLIAERIRRFPLGRSKKAFEIKQFSSMTPFELFALAREIVSIMTIATLEDIEFMFRSLFASKISANTIKEIVSILVGSQHLLEIGEFGHLTTNAKTNSVLKAREGWKETREELLLTLAAIYAGSEVEFLGIISEARKC